MECTNFHPALKISVIKQYVRLESSEFLLKFAIKYNPIFINFLQIFHLQHQCSSFHNRMQPRLSPDTQSSLSSNPSTARRFVCVIIRLLLCRFSLVALGSLTGHCPAQTPLKREAAVVDSTVTGARTWRAGRCEADGQAHFNNAPSWYAGVNEALLKAMDSAPSNYSLSGIYTWHTQRWVAESFESDWRPSANVCLHPLDWSLLLVQLYIIKVMVMIKILPQTQHLLYCYSSTIQWTNTNVCAVSLVHFMIVACLLHMRFTDSMISNYIIWFFSYLVKSRLF